MKKLLLIFMLLSNIAFAQRNYYLDSKLCNENKKQALGGMVILGSMFIVQHASKGTKAHDKVITVGITLSITNIVYYGIKKRKIRRKFYNKI